MFDTDKIELPAFLEALDKDQLEQYLPDRYTNFYIEFRPVASAPIGEEMALPALILGLVENIKELSEFNKQHSWQEWKDAMLPAAVAGFNSKVGREDMLPLVKDMIDIAKEGLRRRDPL